MPCCQLVLAWKPLCLSTQCAISLSLKTMLNNVVSALFLLNSTRLLSNEKFRRVEFLMLVWECLCLSIVSADS